MKTLRIYVSGIVQGVFFRAFVREEAEKRGLKGYVRNLEDGRVEVVVEGEDSKVNEMVGMCKQGPPHAQVENVEISEINHQGFKDFKIIRF